MYRVSGYETPLWALCSGIYRVFRCSLLGARRGLHLGVQVGVAVICDVQALGRCVEACIEPCCVSVCPCRKAVIITGLFNRACCLLLRFSTGDVSMRCNQCVQLN